MLGELKYRPSDTDPNPDRRSRGFIGDRLLLAILGTAVGLAVLVVLIAAFWGSGPVIAVIPWFIPMVSTFTSLTALSVAFLSFGRYQVLRDPTSYWIGMGFAAYGIGQLFYVLAWPGLLPDGRSIIARLTSTPAMITDLNLTILGVILLAAALIRWPGGQALSGRRWLVSVVAWLLFVTVVFILIVSFEQYLPVLVRADGTFAFLGRAGAAIVLLLFAAGSIFSTRYYWHTRDALAGYISFSQMALVFITLMTIIGGKRYDLWWYLQRVIAVGGCLTVLLGLLFEYIQLFRRERESEERYRVTVMNAPAVFAQTDLELRYRWIHNPHPDFQASDVLGKRDDELDDSNDARWLAALKHRVLDSGVGLREEVVFHRSDGVHTYDMTIEPLRNPAGQVVGVTTAAFDITERKQAEEARRVAHEQAVWMARFPDENPNPVARATAEGRVLYRNPAAAEWTEWNLAIDHPLPEVLQPLVEQAMTQGQELEQDVEVNGKVYSISVMPFPEDGYANLYGRDITHRKLAEQALRESEERFHQLADAMPQLVWTALPDGTVDYYNQRYLEYEGISSGTGEAWRWSAVLHSEDIMPTVDAWEHSIETGEVYQIEHRVRKASGEYRWHLSRGVPVRDGNGCVIRWFGTATDIHDLKQAEQTLQKYNEELERSNRELQEFAFVASHDLQEPLRKIEAFGDAVLEETTNLSERQRDYLRRMRGAADRMRSMVNGLLQLSRLSIQAQPFQPVDLALAAAEVISDLEVQIQRSKGIVETGELPVIDADPIQIRQLLQNLIVNGLKFQPPGGTPHITISSHQSTSAYVQIRVKDNGIGFDEAHATHLFEPFKRLVGKGEYEGSGMGLAISRKIAERHGGKIAALSKPGQGATFIVTLLIRQTDVHTQGVVEDHANQTHHINR